MDIIKIAAQSKAVAAAGALANTIRQHGEAEVQGIGPKAVNQAVKAIAIARRYLASSGIDLVTIPTFVDVEIEGQARTAIRFLVKPRHLLQEKKPEAEAKEGAPAPTQAQEAYSLQQAISGKLAEGSSPSPPSTPQESTPGGESTSS